MSDLKSTIRDHVELYDQKLAKEQKPIDKRILEAVMCFFKYSIIETSDGDSEKFWESKWFKYIYSVTEEWYKERYLTSLDNNEKSFLVGVCKIFETPFELNIPKTVLGEMVDNDKRWFCIPNGILESENVFDWVIKQPNFEHLKASQLKDLKEQISNTAAVLRTVNASRILTKVSEETGKIRLISLHLEQASFNILSFKKERICNSFWELHLAIELALKVIVLQNGLKEKKIHVLNDLYKEIHSNKLVGLKPYHFSRFPSDKEAILQRYSEGKNYTVQDALENYFKALDTLAVLFKSFKNCYCGENAWFLIRKAPWVS